MLNIVYLEALNSYEEYQKTLTLKVSIESLIIYCVYQYCLPKDVKIYFTYLRKDVSRMSLDLQVKEVNFIHQKDIPWLATSCSYPVLLYENTVITGLCAVARYICKHRNSAQACIEHDEGLLGFRKSCLQAPNEVSIWTKFCEVDIIKTVLNLLETSDFKEVPLNMVRFENHLNKPVRIHNIHKVAREMKKLNLECIKTSKEPETNEVKEQTEKSRVPKPRKWKSNIKKKLEIDCITKKEELAINHQFAEGPFLTLADLVLLPSYYIFVQHMGKAFLKKTLPLSYKWYFNLLDIPEIKIIRNILYNLNLEPKVVDSLTLPDTDDVSLYKSDPKRHNPKKRLFTKPEDIENALSILKDDLELNITFNDLSCGINWDNIPEGANPSAGHLPDERVNRKSQQLENLALTVTAMAKDEDLIVDFCSGSGHLGILIAYLLPKCSIILLENKEQSLLRARERVHEMGLKNVYFFQCNLDFFIGKFDIGVALHACGIASDLVLDKCLKANAKFVLCPCCYGSLHATDRLHYPRSNKFKSVSTKHYLCIGHTADQTHKEHPLSERGARCMAIIDSDRGRLAEEDGYTVHLSRLKPLSCTPKNNLLIGVPS